MSFKSFQIKMTPKSQESIIKALQDHGFDFCGSRYFAEKDQYGKYSGLDWSGVKDWDFAGRSLRTRDVQFLKDLGFVKVASEASDDVEAEYTLDGQTTSIWKHPDFPVELTAKKDIYRYRRILTYTPPSLYYWGLWKSAPHRPQDEASVKKHKEEIAHYFNYVRY